MNIAVLGTGNVGKALAGALAAAGHVVTMGSRTADNEAALAWTTDNGVLLATFADAASASDLVINATGGGVSLAVLNSVGEQALAALPTGEPRLPCSTRRPSMIPSRFARAI